MASNASQKGLPSEVVVALIKQKLIAWESQFLAENGRVPEKADAYADDRMAALYRKYAHLKLAVGKKRARQTGEPEAAPAMCTKNDATRAGESRRDCPCAVPELMDTSASPGQCSGELPVQRRPLARPPLNDRGNLQAAHVPASKKVNLSRSVQQGGSIGEWLKNENPLPSARGGRTFSRWTTNTDEKQDVCSDQKLLRPLAAAPEPVQRLSCKSVSVTGGVQRDPDIAAQASGIPGKGLNACKSGKQIMPDTMVDGGRVQLPEGPIPQVQARSSGLYAASRYLSKKPGSFGRFSKAASPNESLAASACPAEVNAPPWSSTGVRGETPSVAASEEDGRLAEGSNHGEMGLKQSCPIDDAASEVTVVPGPTNGGSLREQDVLLSMTLENERLAQGAAITAGAAVLSGEQPEEEQSRETGVLNQNCGDQPHGDESARVLSDVGAWGAAGKGAEVTAGGTGMQLGSDAPCDSANPGADLEAKLRAMTVAQLKEQLEGRGLSRTGKKEELVVRLAEALKAGEELSAWEEFSLGGVDGTWSKPSHRNKGRAVPAGRRKGCHPEANRTAGGGLRKQKSEAGKERKRRVVLIESTDSDSSSESEKLTEGAAKRDVRGRLRKRSEGTKGGRETDMGSESDRSFDSADLSGSDDDYKPQAADPDEAAEVAADALFTADDLGDEILPTGKRKRAAKADEEKRGKPRQGSASEEKLTKAKGTKRSRSELQPSQADGGPNTKRATTTAKRRAELQAVGWGGPVRTNKATGKGAGKFSNAGLPVRDNFVRQTLNGRGGGRKRFTNGARASFKSKSGSRPFRRNLGGKDRRGGKVGSRPGVQGMARGGQPGEDGTVVEDAAEQPGLFKDEGWLPGANAIVGQGAETLKPGDPSQCPAPFHPAEGKAPAGGKELREAVPGSVGVPGEGQSHNDEESQLAAQAALADPSESNLLAVLQRLFGFDEFREGQLAAIQRVLAQQSTMLVLPTGGGKSLCYQLPAFLLPSLTLVISPLVALMTDQLQHLPPCLPGALISSAQAPWESANVVTRLRAGELKVLFISPERLFSETFLAVMAGLPPVSLAVVDEAHCVSEWSHNFRPSYHRLGSVLLTRLRVQCVLAMTATATPKSEAAIAAALALPLDGIIRSARVRANLQLSVSKESNKMHALATMLKTGPCAKVKSVIVYCIFQAQTDQVAAYLEANGIAAKSYHSGKYSDERARIQRLFCANKLRVVVATVAFGMGLDKSDVGAVVHNNMPRSMEHYVQEIGRAGRDGSFAHCHLFLDDADYLKLRSLAHSDGCDPNAVLRLLSKVFVSDDRQVCADPSGMETRAIGIEAAARELDLKEEVMATILSTLEVGGDQYLRVLSQLHATCTVTFHQQSPQALAEGNSLVAAILGLCPQPKQGRFTFDVPSLASKLREPLGGVQRELQRLQAAREIHYEVKDPAFCFAVLRQPEDLAQLSRDIAKRLDEVEQCKVAKLDSMYSAAAAAAALLPARASGLGEDANSLLNQRITQNFSAGEDVTAPLPAIVKRGSTFLKADIKVFLNGNKHAPLTGRAVARVFHGLWSPAFPYQDWSKNHFWGRHANVNFHDIRRMATEALVEARSNKTA